MAMQAITVWNKLTFLACLLKKVIWVINFVHSCHFFLHSYYWLSLDNVFDSKLWLSTLTKFCITLFMVPGEVLPDAITGTGAIKEI